MERILFVSESCIIVGFVNVVHCAFELIDELSKSVLVKSMLQLFQKYFRILCLSRIRIQPIVEELTVPSNTLQDIDLSSGNNEFEGIGVTQSYSIQVFQRFFLGND